MKLLALVLHDDRSIAPVDDHGKHFEAIEVYDMEGKSPKRVKLPFDPSADDFDLGEALKIANVTDLVAQHFEEDCFTRLKAHGLHLWLEAPDVKVDEVLEAFKQEHLPEACHSAHAVKIASGKRSRRQGRHPHHVRPSDPGVRAPAHGPTI